MKMPYGRHTLLFLLAVAHLGCATPTPRENITRDYNHIREKWTRNDKLLNIFDLQLSIYATYLSREFRKARREFLTSLYAYDSQEVEKLRQQDEKEMQDGEAFLVGIFMPDRKYDKLDRKRSPWHIRMLVDSLPPLTPVKLIRKKLSRPEREALYPHLKMWDRIYIIVFQKVRDDNSLAIPPGARTLELALDGPLGAVRLIWKLK
ncbi:MAG: hypothetical protein GXP49_17940 [Deltaproteobacteria bacterium]|nr:hypothetical protein [Deltaproteobacteria bacterium]